jgi:hypothetical protein
MKIEATCHSASWANYIPKNIIIHNQCCKNLKSYTYCDFSSEMPQHKLEYKMKHAR